MGVDKIARNSKKLIVDFEVKINDKIFYIEYNGEQHYDENNFFYKHGGYLE